jgi:hypothetical protein
MLHLEPKSFSNPETCSGQERIQNLRLAVRFLGDSFHPLRSEGWLMLILDQQHIEKFMAPFSRKQFVSVVISGRRNDQFHLNLQPVMQANTVTFRAGRIRHLMVRTDLFK